MQYGMEQSMEKQDSLYKETEIIRVQAFQHYEDLSKKSQKSPDLASNLIKTLIRVIEESKETTFQGLTYNLRVVADYIIHQARDTGLLGTRTILTLKSVASIFQHYVNKGLRVYGGNNIQQMHQNLIKISQDLLEITEQAKSKLKQYSLEFFQNGITILVYGYSTAVTDILLYGANKGIKFQVIVCESRPTCEGYKVIQQLENANIECRLIIDSGLGAAIEEADMVLTGAEAVVENGGIINRVGTFTVALCSKSLRKPFYVVSESFKFTREFPLSQADLPQELRQTGFVDLLPSATKSMSKEEKENLQNKFSQPICDYTPPEYITLLFTDVGIFTPSAVSDELIQIFNT